MSVVVTVGGTEQETDERDAAAVRKEKDTIVPTSEEETIISIGDKRV